MIKNMAGTGICTYELITSKRFPVLKSSEDYLIPMEGFDCWLYRKKIYKII